MIVNHTQQYNALVAIRVNHLRYYHVFFITNSSGSKKV